MSSVRWWNIGFKLFVLLVSLLVVFSMLLKMGCETFLKQKISQNHDFTDFFLKTFRGKRSVLTQVETGFLKHTFFAFTNENSCFDMKKYHKKVLSTWGGFSSWTKGGRSFPSIWAHNSFWAPRNLNLKWAGFFTSKKTVSENVRGASLSITNRKSAANFVTEALRSKLVKFDKFYAVSIPLVRLNTHPQNNQTTRLKLSPRAWLFRPASTFVV